ncbi:fasciclin domain-containing protein [Altericroceibacterium endophyticum]|uniref:Fasciclin domain-containing protein n=1 Tax=Altericroceibacterium endophyticum TaxID=1808508 RepID=A0A6I4T728_9SPHN|nr:fasciclin domain-containing protein [Altericroceibacterium endophyticum]MXO66974.1 fasciclin domain-containing protein [Altericroceibacterium endophyticum]
MKRFTLPLLAGAALALSACGSETAEEAPEAAATEAAPAPKTIVDVTEENDDFSTLVSAIQAAQLGGTLMTDGPYTIFAPTNAAFDALPEGTLEELTAPENQSKLEAILTYHVVKGDVSSEALKQQIEENDGETELTTVNGAKLTARMQDGNVVLTDEAGDKATVTQVDVEASNGVVHAIDAVLMPE